MWGWISDLWGRRPVMLLGICGSIFSELLFGVRLVAGQFEVSYSNYFTVKTLNGRLLQGFYGVFLMVILELPKLIYQKYIANS